MECSFIKELTPMCPAHSPWICHDLPSQFWMQNIIIHALSACYIQDWRHLPIQITILCRNLDQGCIFLLFKSNNYVGINEIFLIFRKWQKLLLSVQIQKFDFGFRLTNSNYIFIISHIREPRQCKYKYVPISKCCGMFMQLEFDNSFRTNFGRNKS